MIKTLFALIIFVIIAQKGKFLKMSAYKKWRYLLHLTVLNFNLEYFRLQINTKYLIGYLKLDFHIPKETRLCRLVFLKTTQQSLILD